MPEIIYVGFVEGINKENLWNAWSENLENGEKYIRADRISEINWKKYSHELRPTKYLQPFIVKDKNMGLRIVRFEVGRGNVELHSEKIVPDAEYIFIIDELIK